MRARRSWWPPTAVSSEKLYCPPRPCILPLHVPAFAAQSLSLEFLSLKRGLADHTSCWATQINSPSFAHSSHLRQLASKPLNDSLSISLRLTRCSAAAVTQSCTARL